MHIDETTWVQRVVDRYPTTTAVLIELGVPAWGNEALETTLYELCEAHDLRLREVAERLRSAIAVEQDEALTDVPWSDAALEPWLERRVRRLGV